MRPLQRFAVPYCHIDTIYFICQWTMNLNLKKLVCLWTGTLWKNVKTSNLILVLIWFLLQRWYAALIFSEKNMHIEYWPFRLSLLPKLQSQSWFNALSLYQCTATNSNSRAKRTFKCNRFFCGFLAEIKVHAGTGENEIPQACAFHSSSNWTVLYWVDHRIWPKSNYPKLSKIWKPSDDEDYNVPCSLPSPWEKHPIFQSISSQLGMIITQRSSRVFFARKWTKIRSMYIQMFRMI